MEKTQTRNQTKDLYFVALLLPPDIAAIANHWKQYCAENFSTQGAFNSPPHITLQPPFQWSEDSQNNLKTFSKVLLRIILKFLLLCKVLAVLNRELFLLMCNKPQNF